MLYALTERRRRDSERENVIPLFAALALALRQGGSKFLRWAFARITDAHLHEASKRSAVQCIQQVALFVSACMCTSVHVCSTTETV